MAVELQSHLPTIPIDWPGDLAIFIGAIRRSKAAISPFFYVWARSSFGSALSDLNSLFLPVQFAEENDRLESTTICEPNFFGR